MSSQTPGAHFPEEDYDRLAVCFTEVAPDVAIAWTSIERATLTPLMPPEDGDEAESRIHWHIYGFPTMGTDGDMTDFVVHGDLSVTANGWFLGVTSAVALSFRSGKLPIDPADVEAVNDLSAGLGAWASLLLYDLSALSARTIIATNTACHIELPQGAPKPHFPRLDPASESGLG